MPSLNVSMYQLSSVCFLQFCVVLKERLDENRLSLQDLQDKLNTSEREKSIMEVDLKEAKSQVIIIEEQKVAEQQQVRKCLNKIIVYQIICRPMLGIKLPV